MGLQITNCGVGIDVSAGGSSKQEVGSMTLIDSTFTNVPVGILSAWTTTSQPPAAGSLLIENLAINNVPVVVRTPNGNVLPGSTGSANIVTWGQGNQYMPNG